MVRPWLPGDAAVLSVILLVVVCYWESLGGNFVFDDGVAIVKNRDVASNGSLWEVFRNDFWGARITAEASHKSYRPLTVLSYKFDAYLSGENGLNPYIFHMTNLILYMLTCCGVYVMLKRLLDAPKDAFFASILFTIHPVHVEAVSGLVGRADILYTQFFLLSIAAYQAYARKSAPICLLLYFVAVIASLLCKETGITSLVFCAIYDIARPEEWSSRKTVWTSKRLSRLAILTFFGIVLMYGRLSIMDFTTPTFQPQDNPASFHADPIVRLLSYNHIYALNALLLLWPQWLCFDWSMGCVGLVESATDARIAGIGAMWAMGVAFVWRCWKDRFGPDSKRRIIGAALAAVPFIPSSNILIRVGFVIAERNLFLSTAGYSLLVAIGYRKLAGHASSRWRRPLQLLFALCCIAMVLRTRQRSRDWLSEHALFNSALSVCPGNAKVHYNVAKVAADAGDAHLAMAEYRRAIELHGDYDQAMNNLGNLLKEMGRYGEAVGLLERAVQLRGDNPVAWMNLGNVLAALGRSQEAEKAYWTALEHRKNYSDCFYNLGNLYHKTDRPDEAMAAWRKAITINQDHHQAWTNMVLLLDNSGDLEAAVAVAREALSRCSNCTNVHFCLGNVLGKLKRWKESEFHFLEALKKSPHNSVYYSNLGVLYHRWGRLKDAERMYEEALKLNPSQETALKQVQVLRKRSL